MRFKSDFSNLLAALVLTFLLVPGSHAQTSNSTSSDFGNRRPGNVLRFGVHVSAIGKMDPHKAAGSQDRALPLWQQKRILEILPDTRFELIEGAGHVVYLERKDLFFPLLKAFMRSKSTAFG